MTDKPPVVFSAGDGVLRIVIDRPERRNAMNAEVVREMSAALDRAEDDASIQAVVLTGAGDKAFCAGGDLGGMTSASRVDQHFMRAEAGDLFGQMRASRLPIVARVNGHALAGGFGLMLACDLVIAADHAEMGMPEIDLGLWPFMITALIHRDVPRKVALELMLTGDRVPVSVGERWGFINRVVPPDELDAAVDGMVTKIISKSPLIAGLGKRSFYRSADMATEPALAYLAGMLTVCLESEDTVEGVSAFLAKRTPEWKGR